MNNYSAISDGDVFGDIGMRDSGGNACESGYLPRFGKFEIYGNSKGVIMGSNRIREILLFVTEKGCKAELLH